MDLASDRGLEVELSSIPAPGSPSTSQPQKSQRASTPLTTTNAVAGDSLEVTEHAGSPPNQSESLGEPRLGEYDMDAQGEIDPSSAGNYEFALPPHLSSSNSLPVLAATETNARTPSGSPREISKKRTHLDADSTSVFPSAEDGAEEPYKSTYSVQVSATASPPPLTLTNNSIPLSSTSNALPTIHPPSPRHSSNPAAVTPTSESFEPQPISTSNDAMTVDDQTPINDSQQQKPSPLPSTIDTPSMRTRSRNKRTVEGKSKEPAKRLRTSARTIRGAAEPSSRPHSSASLGETKGDSSMLNGRQTNTADSDTLPSHAQDTEAHDSAVPRSRTEGCLDGSQMMQAHADTSSGPASASKKGTGELVQVVSSLSPPSTRTLSPATVPSGTSSPADMNVDPNLDPALVAQSKHSPAQLVAATTQSTETLITPDKSTNLTKQATNADDPSPAQGSSSLSASEQAKQPVPSPSLAGNPYLSLSTAFVKGNTSANGTTGFNPYALYYGPGTPITPQTPTYPYSYYYLPPLAAPSMYPTSPTFAPSPTTQKTPTSEVQRQKPKRLKAHTVTSGNHNIPIVPRDKKGNPMLPLNVGIMTVIRLGEVCMREHFHTERYIFPVGYEVTRRYLSTVDPTAEVVYHCTILDGGDGPKFQIVPSDSPERTVIAGTATGAWSNIVKQANAIRNRQHSNSVSGPDFFGLGQNTIKHLIQELPGANRLRDYVWQNFVEGGPLGGRHAAVTPALPEDYDSTLPIGALYPAERDRLKREAASSPRGLHHYPQHIIAQAEAQRTQGQQGSELTSNQALDPVATSSQQMPQGAAAPPLNTLSANGHIGVTQPDGELPPAATALTRDPLSPHPTQQNAPGPPSPVPTTIASIMNAFPAPSSSSS